MDRPFTYSIEKTEHTFSRSDIKWSKCTTVNSTNASLQMFVQKKLRLNHKQACWKAASQGENGAGCQKLKIRFKNIRPTGSSSWGFFGTKCLVHAISTQAHRPNKYKVCLSLYESCKLNRSVDQTTCLRRLLPVALYIKAQSLNLVNNDVFVHIRTFNGLLIGLLYIEIHWDIHFKKAQL